MCQSHTISEARDSVDRLHALVEKCYKEMTSRVQALEVLTIQRGNGSGTFEDDTESLPTIHQHRCDANSEEMVESGLGYFDFLDELQRSRVYRRTQAFRESVISALTNSVYSLGWSFLSDLSMAKVSNISVINLVITEGEVFNPRRSLQTWSARPDGAVSTNDNVDGQHTTPYKIVYGPLQAEASAAIARARSPASTQSQQRSPTHFYYPLSPTLSIPAPHGERLLEAKENLEKSEGLDSMPALSLAEFSYPPSSPQAQDISSSASHDLEESDCSVCNIKIEDLVVFIGDQALFKCRNCKNVIENLKYARTSQGILCMQCHEWSMFIKGVGGKAVPRRNSMSKQSNS